MHRNERIAQALSTLQAIEAAVTAQTKEILGLPANVVVNDVNGMQFLQARIDNAVRLYCASDVASSMAACAPI